MDSECDLKIELTDLASELSIEKERKGKNPRLLLCFYLSSRILGNKLLSLN
jgi:hypothetical protein